MLSFKSINGDSIPVTVETKVTRNLNSISQLDFSILNTDENRLAFAEIGPRTEFELSETGEKFIITVNSGASLGTVKQRSITALGIGHKLHDKFCDTKLMGSQSLDACLKFITSGTQFKYTVHDKFNNYAFSDGFGNGYSDDLLINTLAKDFNFEFYFDNYRIHIFKSIGKSNAFLFVDNVNVSKIKDSSDYSNFATHIKGSGKSNDKQKPIITAEYTSPVAKTYGVIDATPVSDERFTDKNSLLNYIKTQLQDYPLISYTVDFANFKKGAPLAEVNDIAIGNSGSLIDRLDINIITRITGIQEYYDSDKLPVITFGNTKFDFNKWNLNIKIEQEKKKNSEQSLKVEVADAKENASKAYSARISGTPKSVIGVKSFTLMTPENNSEMGLAAGEKFYPVTNVENIVDLEPATETADGLLTSTDKAKLDQLDQPIKSQTWIDQVNGKLFELSIKNGVQVITEVGENE